MSVRSIIGIVLIIIGALVLLATVGVGGFGTVGGPFGLIAGTVLILIGAFLISKAPVSL